MDALLRRQLPCVVSHLMRGAIRCIRFQRRECHNVGKNQTYGWSLEDIECDCEDSCRARVQLPRDSLVSLWTWRLKDVHTNWHKSSVNQRSFQVEVPINLRKRSPLKESKLHLMPISFRCSRTEQCKAGV